MGWPRAREKQASDRRADTHPVDATDLSSPSGLQSASLSSTPAPGGSETLVAPGSTGSDGEEADFQRPRHAGPVSSAHLPTYAPAELIEEARRATMGGRVSIGAEMVGGVGAQTEAEHSLAGSPGVSVSAEVAPSSAGSTTSFSSSSSMVLEGLSSTAGGSQTMEADRGPRRVARGGMRRRTTGTAVSRRGAVNVLVVDDDVSNSKVAQRVFGTSNGKGRWRRRGGGRRAKGRRESRKCGR